MPDRRVNPHRWGPPPPPPERRSPGGPWWRRWYVVVAALITLLGVVAFGDDGDAGGPADRPATSSTTTSSVPTTSTAPPTTVPKVEVPDLAGMELAEAKGALADRGLKATVRYRATDRSPAGTVISQSRTSGAGVPPGSRITLVVAKAHRRRRPRHRRPRRPHRRPRRNGTAIRPTPMSASTLTPRTTTARGARGTGPSTSTVRCGCVPPTRSTWTGRATAGAANRGERSPPARPVGQTGSRSASSLGRVGGHRPGAFGV